MKSFKELQEENAQMHEGYNQTQVDELQLYIDNDSDIYRRRISPIRKNLSRKHKAGKYDTNLAVKIWLPLAKEGAKAYEKEYGDGGKIFSKGDIEQVALQMKTEWEEEMNTGNYE